MNELGKKRLPFEIVISNDKLMGKLWKGLSMPQQVALKAFYGLPITQPEELAVWAVLNDNASFDELGYAQAISPTPYEPKEYDTLVGILGRRSGKSSKITAFAVLYEILFGGHTSSVPEGQPMIVPYIAQDLATAKTNMAFITMLAREQPQLEKQIKEVTKDRIEFHNGIIIQPEPPNIKTGRGIAMPVVIMDEVGFWYKTSDNANPDYEVERAVRFAMQQFPHSKMFIISTPYTEEGMLWDFWQAGTDGFKCLDLDDRRGYQDVLVLQAPTASMGNPEITRKKLERDQARDPEAFVRESLARFVTAINGYISTDLIKEAQMKGVREITDSEHQKKGLQPYYVAAIDPAFRHDDFVFTIMHLDDKGHVVQDYLQVWSPDRRLKVVIDPVDVINKVSQKCKEYKISTIYSDQYQLESLQQLALQRNLSIIGVDFTGASKAKIYGSMKVLFKTKSIKILDDPRIFQQLSQLQSKLTAQGNMQISAPAGKKDDIAAAMALAAKMVLNFKPRTLLKPQPEKTIFQEGLECIARKRRLATMEGVWE